MRPEISNGLIGNRTYYLLACNCATVCPIRVISSGYPQTQDRYYARNDVLKAVKTGTRLSGDVNYWQDVASSRTNRDLAWLL